MSEETEDLEAIVHEGWDEDVYAITAAGDPVLAEVWDNEKDAAYDQL
jgi:hypothetical protein